MDDPLLHYYERELTFMRESGAEFARKYPKIAGRLLIEPDRCEDPHTERLLEAFAFLTGRIQKKLDDSFPELTEGLLQIVYPHYTRPVPSMTTVKFLPQLQNVPSSGHCISRGTQLLSPPVKETRLIFTTTQDVRLLPVDICSAETCFPRDPVNNARSGIRIELACAAKLQLNRIAWPQRLRFFINTHQQHAFKLYERIMNNCVHIEVESFRTANGQRTPADLLVLPNENIQAAGFSRDTAMLPWPEQSSDGFRLLSEYFAFPEKFLYFDISGLQALQQMAGDAVAITIATDHDDGRNMLIKRDTFCLYASPAVNLFPKIALPVRVEHKKTDYPVFHDVNTKRTTEVFSVEKVVGITENGHRSITYRPFYSVTHFGQKEDERPYWHLRRRPSPRKGDDGTDVLLAFCEAGMVPAEPEPGTLSVHTLCTNRDLPARLVPGGSHRDFFLEEASPLEGIACLMKPTPVMRPSQASRLQWRLISHLALNYLPLVAEDGQGLKELLKLYDVQDSAVTRQQIDGLESVQHRHVTLRVDRSFCNGVEIVLLFNEDKYVGSSVYLFASVLEHFLAHYVSINSFTRLVIKSIQRTEVIKAWPPRNGNRILL